MDKGRQLRRGHEFGRIWERRSGGMFVGLGGISNKWLSIISLAGLPPAAFEAENVATIATGD
jgi:hypothetical protein